MMLVDKHIRQALDVGNIVVTPFKDENLGTNSYDVTLAPVLRTYQLARDEWPLDVKKNNPTTDYKISNVGVVLQPGELYLASTVEYTESRGFVPMLNGKSSLGRLGLSIHVTAGFGDVGFCGYWTMELFVVRPLRIYAGMKIAQLSWLAASGQPDVTYDRKLSAKYRDQGAEPQASKMHRNFEEG